MRRPEGSTNSFSDLGALDRPENGGNGDGLISAADAVFSQLRLWVDANHDGVSQPGELLTLTQAGIASIELTAQPIGRRDAFGNYFKYRAIVHLTNGQQTTAWDVFLAARLTTGGASAALPGISWPGPTAAGLAGLGGALIALGLAGVLRRRICRRGSSDPRVSAALIHPDPQVRLFPSAAVRAATTGLTTLAVVLLCPAAGLGQTSQTWQVVEYYDTDALGSVRAVTDKDGAVVARHDFLPFGEELVPQTTEKKLFTGQERDFETGQDYFGYRQLRADLGRFLAPDPMTSVPRLVGSQGLNAYAYVRNDPLGLVDPTGLEARAPAPRPLEYGRPSLDDLENFDPLGETGFQRQQQVPVSEKAYGTADEAAIAAMDEYYDISMDHHTEYGGRIVQYGPHEFRYTKAVQAKAIVDGASLDVDDGMGDRKRVPGGATNAGVYHTHPLILGKNPWQFSDGDVRSATKEGVPIYVEMPNRTILKYDYARSASKDMWDPPKQVYVRFFPR